MSSHGPGLFKHLATSSSGERLRGVTTVPGQRRRARVCFPFVGDSVGGSHMSTLLLIEGLEAQGRYEPTLVVHEDGPLTGYLKERAIPFESLLLPAYAGDAPNTLSIAAAMLRNVPRLAGFMRRCGIDIVHGNDIRMNLTWSAAAKLTGRPFVWHQRSLPHSSSPRWRVIALLADHLIQISDAVAWAMPATDQDSTSIIPNPVAPPRETPLREAAKARIARELGFDPSTRVVGFVGRLVAWKRPDIFVTAVARLASRASHMPLAFLIIGHDEERIATSLKMLADSTGVGNKVRFLGFRHPIEEWIRGMDVLMATSEREPFGRTLIEAMALGTPVVAAAAGGHVEIVEHGRTGLLVPPNDVDAFAAAAHRILVEPKLADRLADAGRARALKRYSVDRHVRDVASIYDHLSLRGGVKGRTDSRVAPP